MLSNPAKRKDPARRAQLQYTIGQTNSRFQDNLDRFEEEFVCAHAARPLWLFGKSSLTFFSIARFAQKPLCGETSRCIVQHVTSARKLRISQRRRRRSQHLLQMR